MQNLDSILYKVHCQIEKVPAVKKYSGEWDQPFHNGYCVVEDLNLQYMYIMTCVVCLRFLKDVLFTCSSY